MLPEVSGGALYELDPADADHSTPHWNGACRSSIAVPTASVPVRIASSTCPCTPSLSVMKESALPNALTADITANTGFDPAMNDDATAAATPTPFFAATAMSLPRLTNASRIASPADGEEKYEYTALSAFTTTAANLPSTASTGPFHSRKMALPSLVASSVTTVPAMYRCSD